MIVDEELSLYASCTGPSFNVIDSFDIVVEVLVGTVDEHDPVLQMFAVMMQTRDESKSLLTTVTSAARTDEDGQPLSVEMAYVLVPAMQIIP